MGLLQAMAVCQKIYVDDSSIIRAMSMAFVVEPSTKAFFPAYTALQLLSLIHI